MKARDILGLEPGQSIPMTHRSEEGTLYNPVTQLSMEEMRLLGGLGQAMEGEAEPRDREMTLRVLARVAGEMVPDRDQRERMVANVTAWLDELQMIDAPGPH